MGLSLVDNSGLVDYRGVAWREAKDSDTSDNEQVYALAGSSPANAIPFRL